MNDKILVLEDDNTTRLIIQSILSRSGMEVAYSASIEEANHFLTNNRVDMAVLDYYVGDGTALEIIERHKRVPSIILTAATDLKLAIEALRKGAKHFILKDAENAYLEILEDEIRTIIRENRAEQIIEQANVKINNLLEKVQASINYARRIQHAILPSEKRINEIFPNNFVLYKPKDVVSGDFYWFSKSRGFSFHACADCTGHGVPGSLLSMLGTEMLNKIILLGVTSPDLILTELNTQFMRMLAKGEDGVDDGMDLALVTFDKKNKTLEFAGARNSIFYSTGTEVIELRGDRQSIGGRRDSKEFFYTKQTIKVDGPTTVFLTTDGFTDQFGGPENKKFTKARFKHLLQQIQHLPLSCQKARLDDVLSDWMAGQKQMDDITVTAFQVGCDQ